MKLQLQYDKTLEVLEPLSGSSAVKLIVTYGDTGAGKIEVVLHLDVMERKALKAAL